jgi:ABC-type spermidine/putrescine transport system permease subunit II
MPQAKRPFTRVLCEAVIIALTVVIIGVLTTYAWVRVFPPKNGKKAPCLWPIVGPLFVTGILTYFAREYTGINSFVCDRTLNAGAA